MRPETVTQHDVEQAISTEALAYRKASQGPRHEHDQPRRAASMLAMSILSHFHGSNVGATSCRITTTASK